MPDKELVILRGAPGSGKSTYAKKQFPNHCLYEADQGFIKDDVYSFDSSKLGFCHRQCQEKVRQALLDGYDVIVANTNITKKETQVYINIANECKKPYRIFRLMKNFGSIHNVPKEKIKLMIIKLEEIHDEIVLFDY